MSYPCEDCDESGKVGDDTCRMCGGSGRWIMDHSLPLPTDFSWEQWRDTEFNLRNCEPGKPIPLPAEPKTMAQIDHEVRANLWRDVYEISLKEGCGASVARDSADRALVAFDGVKR